jgi:putative proteasome-type protease
MTYCVGMQLNDGLVFLADSRTNAGVDHISTFRKMTVFEHPGERLLVLLAAGNLAVTQAVRQIVCEKVGPHDDSVWNAKSLFEAVRVVGEGVREVQRRDGQALKEGGIEFNCNFIVGGQIRGERMRLFQIYAAGNFIEATPENPYFQIGEAKYGKPIIDRVIKPSTTLVDATKCLLISFDSTMRSNVSVGLPIDILIYANDTLRVQLRQRITEKDPYFTMIHHQWGEGLRRVFAQLPDPYWEEASA